VKEIENAIVVPLIQGVLFSAEENVRYERDGGTEFYPEGFVLAQSILPLIDDVDRSSARTIAEVMVVGFPSPNLQPTDSDRVRQAMQEALSKMEGVDCSQIGSLGRRGFCPGDIALSGGLNQAPHSLTLLVLFIAFGLLSFTLY